MKKIFERAYLLTTDNKDICLIGAGLHLSKMDFRGKHAVRILLYTYSEDHPVFSQICRIVSETDDELVLKNLPMYLEFDSEVHYTIRPLTLQLFHENPDAVPNYHHNFDKLHSDLDVQNFVLIDLSDILDDWKETLPSDQIL